MYKNLSIHLGVSLPERPCNSRSLAAHALAIRPITTRSQAVTMKHYAHYIQTTGRGHETLANYVGNGYLHNKVANVQCSKHLHSNAQALGIRNHRVELACNINVALIELAEPVHGGGCHGYR